MSIHKIYWNMITIFKCPATILVWTDNRFPMSTGHALACNYVTNKMIYGYYYVKGIIYINGKQTK